MNKGLKHFWHLLNKDLKVIFEKKNEEEIRRKNLHITFADWEECSSAFMNIIELSFFDEKLKIAPSHNDIIKGFYKKNGDMSTFKHILSEMKKRKDSPNLKMLLITTYPIWHDHEWSSMDSLINYDIDYSVDDNGRITINNFERNVIFKDYIDRTINFD